MDKEVFMSLKNKHIVLGITGSIAAYKSAVLARLLVKKGAEVQVVMTPSAKEFITPVTMSTLTGKPVISEFFGRNDGTWHSHVDLGLWADAMLIAPATAATIGKMTGGVANNMLVTTYLSMKAPVFVAPAMDFDMFVHPSTTHNLSSLRSYGNLIIEPEEGELASHLVGKGRMAEPEHIVQILENYFQIIETSTMANGQKKLEAKHVSLTGESPRQLADDKSGRLEDKAAGQMDGLSVKEDKRDWLQGKKILITAGPTYEKLDPVRFIGNYSSGKMGFALAEECASRGAEVYLVAGPVSLLTHNPLIRRFDVESTEQMYDASVHFFKDMDAAILSAAVSDFAPEKVSEHKMKREGDEWVLRLKPTEDIAAKLGEMKQSGQKLVGFALETDHERHHAKEKLQKKHLDFIVLNSLNDKNAGFRYDTNKISIITKNGETDYPLKPKNEVAGDIVDELCKIL